MESRSRADSSRRSFAIGLGAAVVALLGVLSAWRCFMPATYVLVAAAALLSGAYVLSLTPSREWPAWVGALLVAMIIGAVTLVVAYSVWIGSCWF